MAIHTNFLDEYQALPIYQAGSIALGVGTFRCYINSSVDILNVGDHGVGRWFALTAIEDTVFDSIQDREISDHTSSLPWAGKSTGSSLLSGISISAGLTLYGDFTNIKVDSGTIVVYGI